MPVDTFKQGFITVKTTTGTQTFSPAEIAQIDPIHLGGNPYILNMLQEYPAPNDLASGGDKGLNLATLRFNAPKHLDYRNAGGPYQCQSG